jgi:hypothetical protein
MTMQRITVMLLRQEAGLLYWVLRMFVMSLTLFSA